MFRIHNNAHQYNPADFASWEVKRGPVDFKLHVLYKDGRRDILPIGFSNRDDAFNWAMNKIGPANMTYQLASL